ncbi:MAG: signal recognition particle protein [Alphaproteobacteria bacterium]|nr:MAG: signal recognition particle protein [Azospirillum sp. 51_20]
MFESLTDKLSGVFARITSRGVLNDKDIDEAMREIRVALLEADVALPVVKDFVARVKEEARGEKLVRSIQPGQLVVKIVHDELVKLLGAEDGDLNLNVVPPAVILMAGLQGSGKTTSSAKLAKMLGKNRKVLLASLDVYRPAAQEQLEQLARQIGGHSLPIVNGEKPLAITGRALDVAKKGGFDVLILDSAGRLHIDDALMEELQAVKKLASPAETLLVADAMMGQDACNVAREFNEKLGVTGIVLTRIDGSSRAGAALSMRMIAGVPVKYLGTGEKTDEMEEFHADRIAGRILGQGDVVSLVERAIEKVDREEADKMAARMMKGKFDLEDLLSQLRQIQKLGSLGGIMGMIPGLSKFKNQIADAGIGDALIKKQEAIILSMTKAERKNPDIIKASRKKRIAAGSGVEVHDVNKLLKQYEQMASMMKKMGRGGGFGGLASMMKNVPFGKFPGGTGNKFPF